MKSISNASRQQLTSQAAEALKSVEEVSAPEWAEFVKTGSNKERPPTQPDWWYRRAGSILVKIYNFGPIGVSKLRIKFGSKKRRGHKPSVFRKSSGNIIRKILQQLESAGLIKQDSKNVHKGRVITGKGVSLLEQSLKENKNGKAQSSKQKN